MAENLFPESMEEEYLTEEEITADDETTEEPVYQKSLFFDDELEDLKRDATRDIMEATPAEAWVQWCKKTLQTPRFMCEAYSTDIGIDAESAFNAETRDEAETILYTEIDEALMADPSNRTKYIEHIEFTWTSPDAVIARVYAVGADGTEVAFDATIKSTV